MRPVWPRVALISLVVICLFSFLLWWRCWFWGDITTLLLVRHADRVATETNLSAAGLARAQELVHVGVKADIRGIYQSDTDRSRQTVAPLASLLGVTPVEIPAGDVTALVSHILANHRGHTVLVVGHSNTVPHVISAVGGPLLPDLLDNEFDNLFVVDVCRCGWWRRAKVVNLQYGAASP